MIVSDAATLEYGDDGQAIRKVVMINDVARAFFEARATRQICVELPPEDLTSEEGDLVALLEKNLTEQEMQL